MLLRKKWIEAMNLQINCDFNKSILEFELVG